MKFEMEVCGTDAGRGLMEEDEYRDCLGCASSPRFAMWPPNFPLIRLPSFPYRYFLYLMAGSILALTGIATLIWKPVDLLLNERLKMVPGLPPFDWWKIPPDEVILRAYVFNITNGDEFLRGDADKLNVQEIGPYIFREKLYHTDVKFHKNGTMTYLATRKAVFMPEMNNLSLYDNIIVGNIGMLGIPSYLWDSSFFTRQGLTFLMNRLESKPFVRLTVNDYFWNFTDPLLKVTSNLAPFLVPTDNVGILKQIYHDFVDDVTVYIGPEHGPRKFFEIDRWRGGPGLGVWENKTCDSVQGSSEGVHYHQDFRRNDTLHYLRKTICRAVPLHYKMDITRYGMTGYRYDLPNNTFSRPENPYEECYWQKRYPLLPSGVSDVSPCYFNLPIVASFPHYMHADPVVTERIEGLSPDYDKHGSVATVEPVTGIPLIAWARSQCSLYMHDMKGFPRLKRLSNMPIPMFWLEYWSPSLLAAYPLSTTDNGYAASNDGLHRKKQEGLPSYITHLMYLVVIILPATQFYISLGLITLSFLIFSIISSRMLNVCMLSKKGFYRSMNVIVIKSKPTIL